jgi:glycosyltransferase involved in cell wall biosynthesis
VQVHTDFLSPWFVKSGSWYMSLLNRYRCKIAGRVLPETDGIRVVSERIRTSLLSRYDARIPAPAVIPVAVDVAVPESIPLPEHPFKFTLIAVGRLEAEKRIKDVLMALKLVVTAYPITGLFIAGEGREHRRLGRMARKLGLAEKVVFLGDRPDARALMPSAHVFIQASAYEGYGRTLIEAALAKVPIVTTDVGIIGDVLKDGTDALVSPVANPAAMARNIMKLIEDLSLRQELATHAEEHAQDHLASAHDLPARIGEDLARTLHRI